MYHNLYTWISEETCDTLIGNLAYKSTELRECKKIYIIKYYCINSTYYIFKLDLGMEYTTIHHEFYRHETFKFLQNFKYIRYSEEKRNLVDFSSHNLNNNGHNAAKSQSQVQAQGPSQLSVSNITLQKSQISLNSTTNNLAHPPTPSPGQITNKNTLSISSNSGDSRRPSKIFKAMAASSDTNDMMAKYSIPYPQNANPELFKFENLASASKHFRESFDSSFLEHTLASTLLTSSTYRSNMVPTSSILITSIPLKSVTSTDIKPSYPLGIQILPHRLNFNLI